MVVCVCVCASHGQGKSHLTLPNFFLRNPLCGPELAPLPNHSSHQVSFYTSRIEDIRRSSHQVPLSFFSRD